MQFNFGALGSSATVWWERGTGGFDMADLRIICFTCTCTLLQVLYVGTGKFIVAFYVGRVIIMHITAAYYIIDYSPYFTPFAYRVLAKPARKKNRRR